MGREGEGRGSQRHARPHVLSAAAAHPRGVHKQAQKPASSAQGPCPATPRALAVVEEGLTRGAQSEAGKGPLEARTCPVRRARIDRHSHPVAKALEDARPS